MDRSRATALRIGIRVAVGLLGALLVYAAWTAPYWRNWLRLDMSAADRVIEVEKYSPQVEVRSARPFSPLADGAPLPAEAVSALTRIATESGSYAFIVVQDERIRFARYRDGISLGSRFDSYNFHKSLLALAAGYAWQSGSLGSLERPAADFIAAWRNDPRRAITVRQLLQHESGLLSRSGRFRPYDPVMDLFVGRSLHALVADAPLAVTPGKQFDFTHVNAQALYEVIVRATGRDYPSILRDYLWTPLGAAPALVALDRPGGDARGICCFIATADAWLRIGSLLANRGRFDGRQVVDERWIEWMLQPAARNPNFGFNLWIGSPQTGRRLQSVQRKASTAMSGPFAADDVYFVEASGAGRLYFVPSRRLVVLRFGEFAGPFPKWDDAAIVNAALAGVDR